MLTICKFLIAGLKNVQLFTDAAEEMREFQKIFLGKESCIEIIKRNYWR